MNEAATELINVSNYGGINNEYYSYEFNVKTLNSIIEICEANGYDAYDRLLKAYFNTGAKGQFATDVFVDMVDEISGTVGTMKKISDLLNFTTGMGETTWKQERLAKAEISSIIKELENG